MDFLNRLDDLAAIDDAWTAAAFEGQFFVLWGRRRVGKTELLNHFANDKRAFYFEATDATETIQLRNLSDELAVASSNPLFREAPFPSWRAALEGISQFVGAERTLVVLDEFQFLAARQQELATLLNTWLRRTGRHLPMLFIIAGSEVSFFREEVLGGQLYGRRTGQLAVRPFSPADASLFVPKYSPEDKVRTYAICGGMPYYLAIFDDELPLEENILGNILYRGGLLHEEAELLLRQELPDPLNYFSVLDAIAHGCTRNAQIAARTGLGLAQVSTTLRTLARLELVEQRRPATASRTSSKTSWAILDGFLNFHFRFVEPFRSRLRTRRDAQKHLADEVLPNLDHFVSKPAWEHICQQHLLWAEGAKSVGAWWGKVQVAPQRTEEREVDAVAVDINGSVTATGSCKWTNALLDADEDKFLTAMEAHIPGADDVQRHYFFSRTGFDEKLNRLASADPDRYKLITPSDLFT